MVLQTIAESLGFAKNASEVVEAINEAMEDHLESTDPFAHYYRDTHPDEQEFNNGIREITILVLAGIILYISSYAFLTFLRRQDRDEEFLPYCWEDEIVYKTSFAICSFAMAVSVGAALLLPISTISNEILHRYPSSWYIRWLNTSLINGIWNLIFVLSNTCLFIFLPFAYLFCESEGLPFFGNKRGLIARAKETLVTLTLLALTILGMMYIVAALIDRDRDSIERLLNIYSYLPFLYSCVSFLGVLMLLLCTPLGFARLFTIVGDLVIKPTFMRNLDDEYFEAKFEEENLVQKINAYQNKHDAKSLQGTSLEPIYSPNDGRRLKNGEVLNFYKQSLTEVTERRQKLDRARKTSTWRRILGYPLILLVLLALTVGSLVCVILNVLQILSGFRSLPINQQIPDLGLTSLSTLGVIGVVLEVILIGYLFVTSLIGLYTIPLVSSIKPDINNTSLTSLILNCGLFVILSSALPLLAKILGITNFDLLGSFGEIKWLGNLYIILFYNAVFAIAASLCLFFKFTARVRQEIKRRVTLYISTIFGKKVLDSKQNIVTSATSVTSPVSAKTD